MSKTEQMLATGKKFSLPSEDPIGVSRSLRLNTDVANMEQYKRNVEDAQSWLDTTESALDNMVDIFQRTKELTLQAASETNSIDERKAIANEIKQLKDQIINTGNTTYAGSYIFSGFKTNKALLDDTGKYSFDASIADPMTLTNGEEIKFNIGIGDSMAVNILPQKIFGKLESVPPIVTADSPVNNAASVKTGDKPQMIQVFDDLIAGLEADSTADISKSLDRLDIHFSNINAVRSEIGVKTNRLELTMNRIEGDTLNLKSLLSKNEDADMAEVIMNLKMQESVYTASLSGGARIIQPTLLDFLR
jgi:flagellar hook-associated protein 3 FlgL